MRPRWRSPRFRFQGTRASVAGVEENAHGAIILVRDYQVWEDVAVEIGDGNSVRSLPRTERDVWIECTVAFASEHGYGPCIVRTAVVARNNVRQAVEVQVGDLDVSGIETRRKRLGLEQCPVAVAEADVQDHASTVWSHDVERAVSVQVADRQGADERARDQREVS